MDWMAEEERLAGHLIKQASQSYWQKQYFILAWKTEEANSSDLEKIIFFWGLLYSEQQRTICVEPQKMTDRNVDIHWKTGIPILDVIVRIGCQ